MIKVTDRTLTTLITLTGVRATGYTVRVSGFDGMQDIPRQHGRYRFRTGPRFA